MKKTVSLRISLGQHPTLEDRISRRGDLFLSELRSQGWADENNKPLKNFQVTSEGYAENGEYYFEWVARLEES